jgi:putative phage-type endonuclease
MAELSLERKGRITGSAVGAILGMSPWMSPDDVMRRMVRDWHNAEPEFTGNQATAYGQFHEAGAIVDFEMATGKKVKPSQFYKYGDWLGATPDGEIGEDGLIEVKCPYSLRNTDGDPKFKSIHDQPHYYAQLQIEMLCAGKKHVEFFQWSPKGSELDNIDFDQIWLEQHMPALMKFYERYLVERDNPGKYLDPLRVEIETRHAKRLIDEYFFIAGEADRLDERKKEILAEIVDLSKGHDATICGHKLTKVVREGAVSYAKAIKELLPNANLEPYRGKPSEFWKLT